MQNFFIVSLILLWVQCRQNSTSATTNMAMSFGEPVKVSMMGYSGNIMEPFISRRGNLLLFNNLNAVPENTNLHWATKISDTVFRYEGEIGGINTADLEAVPSMDSAGDLLFVSTRSYASTFSTLYECNFSQGAASNVHLVDGISKAQPGWVNFDVEISANGQYLYFVDAQFDISGNPATADLTVAKKSGARFIRLPNSGEILQNINSPALEYAACISDDQLQLYFTRTEVPLTPNSLPRIFVATRKNVNDAFGTPEKINSITGFVEGPTLAPDQHTLYYHKKENNRFVLYMVRKR